MAVPTFGYAKQPLPIAARMLSGDKPKPRCHVPTVLELCTIADGCDDCRCGLRPNASDLGEPLAGLITSKDLLNLTIEPFHTGIELAEHVEELFEHRRKQIAESISLSV